MNLRTKTKTMLIADPHFSAYHYLLYQVALHMRNKPDMGREQLFDLGDAIHNIPEFLTQGTWDEPTFRKLYLTPYDRKWAKKQNDFSMIRTLNEAYELIKARDRI